MNDNLLYPIKASKDGYGIEEYNLDHKALHPLMIGNIRLHNNIILAPMAGVSDRAFRLLCHRQGAGLVCMEMISAKAYSYGNKKTIEMAETSEEERPVSLQIFGSDYKCMSDFARKTEGWDYDILDINMGCPVHKVVSNGEGSALMKDPKKAYEIVSVCVGSTDKPVTVKIRKGFDDEHINACEIALAAEAAGASAVAVHARTRQQFYSGRADWSVIADVKRAVKIPVIGNGDITCAADVSKMYGTTGCDGFMIGRAAQGNPWIFSDIISELKEANFLQNDSDAGSFRGETCSKPAQKRRSFDEMRKMLLLHARMEVDDQGERVGIQRMRKHMAWYTAGYPNSAKLRGRLAQMNTMKDLEAILDID